VLHTPKRLFVGRALHSDRLGETLLPKRLALPVFCSDPLSLWRTRPSRSCWSSAWAGSACCT
jgi:hypothetical protein